MTLPLPILPTTTIGSYSMPEWLERAKNDYLSRRVSRRDLDEMHDAVRKACIKDLEAAGILRPPGRGRRIASMKPVEARPFGIAQKILREHRDR